MKLIKEIAGELWQIIVNRWNISRAVLLSRSIQPQTKRLAVIGVSVEAILPRFAIHGIFKLHSMIHVLRDSQEEGKLTVE